LKVNLNSFEMKFKLNLLGYLRDSPSEVFSIILHKEIAFAKVDN
jgi:hypothetical protein